ncbi:ATP-binding protein [bacterium]|nr:ATP-binding protein [candidate division CSSED10-310 bacterium]
MSTCLECQGTGWRIVNRDGHEYAVRCNCFYRDMSGRLFQEAGIPQRYFDCTIASFQTDIGGANPSAKAAQESAWQFIKDFPGQGAGLLFMGPCGVGKTHLAVGILKYLMDTYHTSCLFYDFRQLLQDIRSTYNANSSLSESEIFDRISKAKVLLLDELGAEKLSGWLLDTLTYLINFRYNNKQIMIITTNYLDNAVREGDELLQDRIGNRLRSRLYEMCQTVVMGGQDYRKAGSDKLSNKIRKAFGRRS